MKLSTAVTQLTITPSDSTIQNTVSYKFSLLVGFIPTIPQNSDIQIIFPNQFASIITSTNLNCYTITWPTATPNGISCSIYHRTLTITKGFQFGDFTSFNFQMVLFQWTVQSIVNPLYAYMNPGTGVFSGIILDSNSNIIDNITQATGNGVQITPGSLNITMSINPTMVFTDSTLTMSITPTHQIPSSASLYIQIGAYWQRDLKNKSKVFTTTAFSCNQLQNVPVNLYCQVFPYPTIYSIRVYNVFPNNASTTPPPYKFTITSFLNPPTLQPQGSIAVRAEVNISGTLYTLDETSGNKVTSSIPRPVLTPSLSILDTKVSASNILTINLTISSWIYTTDTFVFGFPKQITVSNISAIIVSGSQATNVQIDQNSNDTLRNIVSFKGVSISQISTLIPIKIQFRNVTNPSYVTSISNFTFYTLRNNFLVDQLNNRMALSLTTTSGLLTCVLSASSNQAGAQNVSYTFQVISQHAMYINSIITITVPQIMQVQNRELTCSNGCRVSISGTLITLSNIIPDNETLSLTFTLSNFKNVYDLGLTSSMIMSFYNSINSNYELVDKTNSGITMTIQARQLPVSKVTISSNSLVVYNLAQITLDIINQNPIPSYSTLRIKIPSQLQLPSPPQCTPACISTSTSNVIDISLSGSSSLSLPSVILKYIRNPKSTKPTSSFQILILNQNLAELQYVRSGIFYTVSQLATGTLQVYRNSTKNSQLNTQYIFTGRVPFDISNPVAVEIGLPLAIEVTGYAVSSYDSQNKYYRFTNVPVTNIGSNFQLSITMSSIKNYLSKETQTITIKIMDKTVNYGNAQASLQIQNTLTNIFSSLNSFSVRNFKQITSLTLQSIIPTGIFSYFQISFGINFDITSATCNSDYRCQIISQIIKVTPVNAIVSASSVPDLIINNLLTPDITPSNAIIIKSYTINNSEIDASNYFYWTTLCTPPCKTCMISPILNASYCQSCYLNQTLPYVQGNILLFNNTCVPECGQKYYRNFTTNICQTCSTSCSNCLNFSICLSCSSTQYLLTSNNTCYTTCPNGYYKRDDTIKLCLQCALSLNCSTCQNSLTCLTCKTNYFYYQQQCIQNCPINITVNNTFTRNCDSCPINCTKCILGSTDLQIICIQCQNGFLLDNGRCYESCRTLNTVPNGKICGGCNIQCKTCIQTPYKCLTCDTSNTSVFKYFLQNNCLQNCPNGYYPDSYLFLCALCTLPCQYCVTSSVNSCRSCIAGFSLSGSQCLSTCPAGTYLATNNSCTACISNCSTCLSDTLCMTCIQNYFLRDSIGECLPNCGNGYTGINGKCLSCSSNCKTCQVINYCTSCHINDFLLNGTCMNPCIIGYYGNINNFLCTKCYYSCIDCFNDTYCTSCQAGYQLTINNSCKSTCDNGFTPVNGICTACDLNCTICTVNISYCTACINNFYHNQISFQCQEKCPLSLFSYQANLSCIQSCPTKYFQQINNSTGEKSCIACENLCLQCTSITHCSICQSGNTMLKSQGKCYQNCPLHAPYAVNGFCLTCFIVQCYQCDGSNCKQCNNGYLMIGNNQCINSCGQGKSYNQIDKICQNINNSTTTINNTNSTTSEIQIKFVPLPFIIGSIVLAVIIGVVHCAYGVSIVSLMMSFFSITLIASVIVNAVVYYLNGTNELLLLICIACAILVGISMSFNLVVTIIQFFTKAYAPIIQDANRCPVFIVQILAFIISYKILTLFCLNPKVLSKTQFSCKKIWIETQFLSKFNIICSISITIILGYIICGVFFVFNCSYSQYSFYGGIQLIILSILEIIITIMWISGVRGQSKNAATQDLYKFQDSIEKMTSHQQINQNDDDPVKLTQGDKKSVNNSQPVNVNYEQNQKGERLLHSRKYKSMYPRMKDTIKISKDNIQEAFDQGVFRRNQQSLMKQRIEDQQLSQLDSAGKFNQVVRIKQIQKQEQYSQQKDNNKLNNKNQTPFLTNQKNQQKQQQLDQDKEIQLNNNRNNNFNNNIIFQILDQNIQTHPDQNDQQENQSNFYQQQNQNKYDQKNNLKNKKTQSFDNRSLGSVEQIKVKAKQNHNNNGLNSLKNQNNIFMIEDLQDDNEVVNNSKNQGQINVFDRAKNHQDFSRIKKASKIKEKQKDVKYIINKQSEKKGNRIKSPIEEFQHPDSPIFKHNFSFEENSHRDLKHSPEKDQQKNEMKSRSLKQKKTKISNFSPQHSRQYKRSDIQQIDELSNQNQSQQNNLSNQFKNNQNQQKMLSSIKKSKLIHSMPKQVIHADLQSIGTVQQDEDQENNWNQFPDTVRKNPFIFDPDQDLRKPSQLLRKTVNYMQKKQKKPKKIKNKDTKK